MGIDLGNRTVTVAGPDGLRRELGWERLVLAPGSVSRTLPVPGLLEQAKGFKNIAEALFLRDHLIAGVVLTPGIAGTLSELQRGGFDYANSG